MRILSKCFIPVCMICYLWWGMIYPEYSFNQSTCRVVDEEGKGVTLSDEEWRVMYQRIREADAEDVTVKSGILQWLKELFDGSAEDEAEGKETLISMREKARILVKGRQQMEEEVFETSTEAVGFYEEKDGIHILDYEEKTEDGVISNRVEISSRGVIARKSGMISAEMVFRTGQEVPFVYETPQGGIPFVAIGGNIKYNKVACGLEAAFDYILSMGEFRQNCEMEITAEILS